MEDNDYVSAFDHLYTTNHIQILKSVLPFINADSASMLPVMIKYLELRHTLSMVGTRTGTHHNIRASSIESDNEPFGNIETIYNAIRRYLAPNEDKSLNQVVNALKVMQNMRQMQAMMELLDINTGEQGVGGFDINEIMKIFGGNMNGT